MRKLLTTKKTSSTCYDIIVGDDGHAIGRAIMDVDGYFYYLEYPNLGVSSAHTLRVIADILDELNKSYDDHLTEYFKTQQAPNEQKIEESFDEARSSDNGVSEETNN